MLRNGAFNPIERAAAARPGMIGPLQTTRRRLGEAPGRMSPFPFPGKRPDESSGHTYADSARTLGQMSASGHSPHRGRRASQISLPSMIH